MSEKFTENSEMYRAATVSNASVLMKQLWPMGSVKERITAAAQALGWSVGRAEDMWRAEARIITGEETIRLLEVEARIKAKRQERAAALAQDIEETAHDFTDLVHRLDRMEAMVASFLAAQAGAPTGSPKPVAG